MVEKVNIIFFMTKPKYRCKDKKFDEPGRELHEISDNLLNEE